MGNDDTEPGDVEVEEEEATMTDDKQESAVEPGGEEATTSDEKTKFYQAMQKRLEWAELTKTRLRNTLCNPFPRSRRFHLLWALALKCFEEDLEEELEDAVSSLVVEFRHHKEKICEA